MPMTGREATMAFGVLVANSWGVPTSVTRRVYFESDAGLTSQPAYVDDASFGQAFLGPADVGDFAPVEATLSGQAYYDHADYILEAMAMGSPNAVTVVSSVAASSLVAYSHIIDLAPNTNGRAITLATDKVQGVEEITSAKVRGFGLAVGTGGVMTKRVAVMGAKSTMASAVNTRSAVSTSALAPALTNRIMRLQGTWLFNAQAAATLAATDAIEVEDATIEFDRPLSPAQVFGSDYTIEPLDGGFPSARITLGFARARTTSVNSLYVAMQAGTTMKGKVTFTGGYINSTTQRSWALEFPHAEVQQHEFSVTGADQAKPRVTLVLKQATAAPQGFLHARPFRLTRITSQSLVAF